MIGNLLSRLLVVDDDICLRTALARRLAHTSFFVLEAADADEAVAILEVRNDVGVICTDVDMPGSQDGLALAASVSRRWPQIKIVVTSGRMISENDDIPTGARFFSKYVGAMPIVQAVEQMWPVHPAMASQFFHA